MAEPAPPAPPARSVLLDAALVLLMFAAAGAVAGALWPHLVEPVRVVRTDFGIATDEAALRHRISDDGWYSLLAAGLGLVLGVVATAWRRVHEVVTVVAVTAGGALAALLSAVVGRALGPEDPERVLRGAAVGTSAPDVVRVYAEAAYLVWPLAAVLGALAVLWGPARPAREAAPASDEVSPADPVAPHLQP